MGVNLDTISVVISECGKFEIDQCRVVAVYREHTDMHAHQQAGRQAGR